MSNTNKKESKSTTKVPLTTARSLILRMTEAIRSNSSAAPVK